MINAKKKIASKWIYYIKPKTPKYIVAAKLDTFFVFPIMQINKIDKKKLLIVMGNDTKPYI